MHAQTWLETASEEELVEHILNRYHDTHRDQLPEMIRLAQRVERVHGSHPDCPSGLSAHLETMQEELESHMAKEEQILFSMITRGISGMARGPISVMRAEHEDHSAALAQLGVLTNNLRLPEEACNTWKNLYQQIATFQTDLNAHIALENSVLFARIDGMTA
ncbi:MAG: hemerythrin domain-containing protein [Marinobacter sp.]|nr:hemerythrin domain-containing protein [Marinobacter sp.]